MSTITQLQTDYDTIKAYIQAGNYASAAPLLDALVGELMLKPDTDFSKSGLEWDRESLLAWAKQMQAKADRQAITSEVITQIPVRRQSSACSSGTCGCSSS